MSSFKFNFHASFFLFLVAIASVESKADGQVAMEDTVPLIDLKSPNLWSAGGNASYMTRSNPSDIPIWFRGVGTNISANQLDFDFSPGYEAFVAKSFDGGGKVEFEFSSLENMVASASSIVGFGDALATNPPSPFFAPPVLSTLTLDSEITSGELNLYIPLTQSTDWSLGFRWIEYDETMVWNRPGFIPVTIATNVDNHLYGLQTGLDTLLTTNDVFELSIFGKGGVYGNDADQVTSIETGGLPWIGRSFDTSIAGIVETGINGKLKLTNNVAINFGYTGLYLTGLALAPDQLNTHSPVLSGFTSTRLDTSSTFYHGGFVGLTVNN